MTLADLAFTRRAAFEQLRRCLPADASIAWRALTIGHLDPLEQHNAAQGGAVPGIGTFHFVWRGRFHAILILSPGEPPSAAQRAFREAVENAGGAYSVCRSLPDLHAALRAWGIPLRGRAEA